MIIWFFQNKLLNGRFASPHKDLHRLFILQFSMFSMCMSSEVFDILRYFMSFESTKAFLAPLSDNGNILHALLMMQSTGESGSPGYQHKVRLHTETLSAFDPDLSQKTFPPVKKYIFHFSSATCEMLPFPWQYCSAPMGIWISLFRFTPVNRFFPPCISGARNQSGFSQIYLQKGRLHSI